MNQKNTNSEIYRTAVFESMTHGKPIFAKNAVGISFLNPEKTGTLHLDVNPYSGAIIVAEAHTIRMRGSGVSTDTLNELSDTAAKLISEYLSNHLLNARHSDKHVNVKNPSFRDLLGQTISGLDQILIETVTSDSDNVVAYHMEDSRHKIQAPSTHSLLNKITNSLEAVVYYNGGIHISHRGESQQYLITKRVQKLTKDHMAGGLFSKIGDVGDFIPQIHTQTKKMSRKDRLVIFSREAAVPSFPLSQLTDWMGGGDPEKQAQSVAEELKKLGKTTGCVMVFAPSWTGTTSDDISVNGVFSLNNLANLKRQPTGKIQTGPSIPPEKPTTGASTQIAAASTPTTSSRKTMAPKKRNSRAAKSSTATSSPPAVEIQPERPASMGSKPKSSMPKSVTSNPEPKSSIPKAIAALSRKSLPPATPPKTSKKVSISNERKSKSGSKKNSFPETKPSHSQPPPRPSRRPIAESEIKLITETVLKQLNPHLEKIEQNLQTKLEGRFSKLKGDVSNLVGEESSRILKKMTADNLPGMEHRIKHNVHNELNQLEHRLRGLMDESLHLMQDDAVRELSQGTLNAKQLLQRHRDAPQNALEETVDEKELTQFFNEDDEEDTHRLDIANIRTNPRKIPPLRKSTPPPPRRSTIPPPRISTAPPSVNSSVPPQRTATVPPPNPTSMPPAPFATQVNPEASSSPSSYVTTVEPDPIWTSGTDLDSPMGQNISQTTNAFTRLPQFARILIVIGIAALITSAIVLWIFPGDTNKAAIASITKAAATVGSQTSSSKLDTSSPRTLPTKSSLAPTSTSTPKPPTPDVQSEATTAAPEEQPLSKPANPFSNMNTQEIYEKGLELYVMGDWGKTKNNRRLTKAEQRAALLEARSYFEHLVAQENITTNNVWFLKGRTEYNLTKTERDDAKRRKLAESALLAYEEYRNAQRRIPKSKAKTIKRNQHTLRSILK